MWRSPISQFLCLLPCLPPDRPICHQARRLAQRDRNSTESAVTFAKSFREAGYTTNYIGKWHLMEADNSLKSPTQRGWVFRLVGGV